MHVHVFDALVVGVAVAAELEIVLRDLAGPRWLLLSAVWLYTLPLLARRRWPLAAPVFVICLQVLTSFVDVPGSVRESMGVVAYVLAFWVLASHNPLREAILGLMVGLAGIVMVALEDPRVLPREAVSVAVYASLTWLAGVALRQRNLRVARAEDRSAALERDQRDAQAAVVEERARIARELHDVVAHSVSVMVVQAGAVRRLLRADQERERDALMAVEGIGREALTEMRRLLEILREPDESGALSPQPTLDRVDALVEQVREAGLPVQLNVEGQVVPLPPGVDLCAFRIVQEALTNTIKHAGPARAEVHVRYGGEEVEIEVSDNGKGMNGAGDDGHGLLGMKERAILCGGTLETGDAPGGGFAVRARLPLHRATT